MSFTYVLLNRKAKRCLPTSVEPCRFRSGASSASSAATSGDARLRRRIRASTLAERALISRTTLHKIERGDAGVSMGMYATVLFVLGMHDGIADLADRSRDGIGLDLLEERLPQRVRVASAARRKADTRSLRVDD